jgi:DNA polymerase elongation subunit (family B)
MHLNNAPANPKRVKGWVFDLYPSAIGEITVWIITENGQRVRLTDRFKPKVYVSGRQDNLERLTGRLFNGKMIASWKFAYKYASVTDLEKSRVLEVELKDCVNMPFFTREVLELGRYLQYRVHNCDLRGDQAYLYERDIFPLALVEVESEGFKLKYNLLDTVESLDYQVPPLRIMRVQIKIAKKEKIANLNDPISSITVTQADRRILIDSGDEREKLLRFVEVVKEKDPDFVLTKGGDQHLFSYLARRAAINGVLNKLILSRENVPVAARQKRGRTFFSYGRSFYRAPMRRLYGRVHLDENNTFILNECGLQGLIEIARTCKVPLHRASRSSIGSSMNSLQFYQAIKNDVLIPRNKEIPEVFKSAYDLLVADRGGFVYEPRVGIHDHVGELDFAAMYPSLMVRHNISAETVLCKCCPNSGLRIPEVNYHICERREGIVPKALRVALSKRLLYKRLRAESKDPVIREVYDKRQAALKWILVTCFGYLGYKNAKFGTVDGHIGVCALGRDAFLRAARMAENRGFSVIHGIVDSLWLKREDAANEEYLDLCKEISEEIDVPLNFEGRYKWIIFLPSRLHPRVGVLNRYYGVFKDGKIKTRGLEVRRRDTAKFVFDAQMEMIEVLALANNTKEFVNKIPQALNVVRKYRQRLLDGEIPIWDLIVTKHLSKDPKQYKQKVSQVIAAQQLIEEGARISAGQNLRFVYTSAENKRYERRVRAEELIEENTVFDAKKYLHLLYASAANLLSFLGYSAKSIQDYILRDQSFGRDKWKTWIPPNSRTELGAINFAN